MEGMKTQSQESNKGMITKDMTIQSLFDNYPGKAQKLAQVMTNAGLSCIGCHASTFETLEQGMLGHGYSEEELRSLLNDLNKVLNEKVKEKDISLTQKAAEKVKELLNKEKKSDWGLKISVEAGGCSGSQYLLGFQKSAQEGENILESNGVKLFFVKEDAENFKGAEIDYVDGLMGAGFKINNPNVKRSCGCGNSVCF